MAKHTEFFKLFAPILMVLAVVPGADAASVAKRGTSSVKATTAARAPVANKTVKTETVSTSKAEDTVDVQEETFEFEDRTGQFDDALTPTPAFFEISGSFSPE